MSFTWQYSCAGLPPPQLLLFFGLERHFGHLCTSAHKCISLQPRLADSYVLYAETLGVHYFSVHFDYAFQLNIIAPITAISMANTYLLHIYSIFTLFYFRVFAENSLQFSHNCINFHSNFIESLLKFYYIFLNIICHNLTYFFLNLSSFLYYFLNSLLYIYILLKFYNYFIYFIFSKIYSFNFMF